MASALTYLLIILLIFPLAGILIIIYRYFQDMRVAREKIKSLGSQVIETACGPIEFAQKGQGYPILMIHGAMGGFDHGLWLAEELSGMDFRIVSPSRFGYLRTPIPPNANLDLQADSFASLLDHLKIRKVAVFAISAGSTSAIRFTARNPERVSALILFGPDSPGEVQMQMPSRSRFETVMGNNFIYWILITFFRNRMKDVMGLAPKGYVLKSKNKALIKKFLYGVLPIRERMKGLIFESYDLIPEFNESIMPTSPYPLGRIKTPVLVINAKDDPLAIPENVRALADLLPNSHLYLVPDGGHLFFGHDEEVRAEINRFLVNNQN